MNDECKWDEAGGQCLTHGCGFERGPCMKPDCPHCGKRTAQVNSKLLTKRLVLAQRRLERWEVKLARAANEVVSLRQEVRRYWKKLEATGVPADPMALAGQANKDGEIEPEEPAQAS